MKQKLFLSNFNFLPSIIIVLVLCLFCIRQIDGGKIPANMESVDIGDFRFGLGEPYVIFYEREGYRGKVLHQKVSKSHCNNLPEPYMNWASSLDLQRRCVQVCDQKDCKGKCVKALPDHPPKSERGVARLKDYGLNDKVVSIKFCF